MYTTKTTGENFHFFAGAKWNANGFKITKKLRYFNN